MAASHARAPERRTTLSPAVARALLALLVAAVLLALLVALLREPAARAWRAAQRWVSERDMPPLEEEEEEAAPAAAPVPAPPPDARKRSESDGMPATFLVFDDASCELVEASELRRRRALAVKGGTSGAESS